MQIQHNIMAMNAYRNYASNTSALSKNLEKLSSGYKINRAGDDAAGLAISEKMRAQITGLNTAQDNAKSGINLVQTAEGSMTEVHDMLNRMVELSDQSANGTYDDETDRANLQKEVTQLKSEINRIADSSNFNGIKLLDGSLSGASSGTLSVSGTWGGLSVTGTPVTAEAQEFTSGALSLSATTPTGSLSATVTVVYTDTTGKSLSKDVSFFTGTTAALTTDSLMTALSSDNDLKDLFTVSGSAAAGIKMTSITAGTAGGGVSSMLVKTASADGVTLTTTGSVTKSPVDEGTSYDLVAALKAGDSLTIDGKTYSYVDSASGSDGKTFGDFASLQTAAAKNGVTLTDISSGSDQSEVVATANEKGLTLQIGDTSDSFNKLKVSIQDMHADSLGIGDIDISTQSGAASATDLIKTAINTVSSVRGTLGATQNRLEHTINNLSVMTENVQDAESSIRDTDVAQEMMAYTKNNILVQSAQAMLAQANQVPQGVLQLLQ